MNTYQIDLIEIKHYTGIHTIISSCFDVPESELDKQDYLFLCRCNNLNAFVKGEGFTYFVKVEKVN